MKTTKEISLKAVDNIAISDIIITVNDIFLLEPNAKRVYGRPYRSSSILLQKPNAKSEGGVIMVKHRGGYLVEFMRKKAGYSQSKLAKEIGISQSHLSEIENGTKNPSLDVLKKLTDKLGFSADEFIEGRDV